MEIEELLRVLGNQPERFILVIWRNDVNHSFLDYPTIHNCSCLVLKELQ